MLQVWLYLIILKEILPPTHSTLIKQGNNHNLVFLVKVSNIGFLHVFWFYKSLWEVLCNDFLFNKGGCGERRNTKET